MSSDRLPSFFEVSQSSYLDLAISLSEIPANDFQKYNRDELLYYLFENVFYNSKIVKDKQRHYLKFIEKKISEKYPFLDVGCGRGEFLEILLENNINCLGIDVNQLVISLLKKNKLPVQCSDALSYLDRNDNNEERYSGISAIQVIEHLNINYLNEFLSKAFKRIVPGGLIILETINPHCLYALSNFYQDSTHIKPLPPEMMKFLLEWHGFERVSIVYSSPIPETSGRYPDIRMNYQDYALVGYKSRGDKNILVDVESEQKEVTASVSERREQLLKVVIDAVFFQMYKTGIARVWQSLLEEWANNGFSNHIVVLDRAGTAPKVPGIRYRPVPPYDYGRTDADREMLQQVCDEEGADLFISSYYTTPLSTPSVFMAYDMIPEVMGWDLNHPMWREKHYAIQHASAYMAISENTARDLVKFFPHISSESVTVALCGVKRSFLPASLEEVNSFRTKYGISKPYFIVVGTGGYKNTILFFQAFAQLYSRGGFEIVCTGSGSILEAEFRSYTSGSVVHTLQLSDQELKAAYSGAVALVYPSKYEGFGLPVLEAIACGCPVITCPNASIPEVAGEAALYVNHDDVDGLANALCDVQKPNVRNSLIAAGLEQAKKFSWSKMAKTVGSALIDATLLPLNLKNINLIVFPDWSQSEEALCFDLERVIKAIATHPDSSQITLLVETGNITDEEAALILSSVTMNLLLQEDLDVSEGPEITLVGQLSEIQWEALLPRIHSRISLKNENKQAIAVVRAENIPSYELDSLSDEQAAQLKTGIWDITGHSEILHFNRGMALQKQGKFAEAMSSYQKALEIKPDFAEARYQLSITLYQNQVILKGYQFNQDWFSWNVPIWEQHLKQFINIPTLNVLEIGSWEGRSTCWLLDNILTHESNKITCIDTFEGSVEIRYDTSYIQSIEGRFDFNIAKTGVPDKVQKIVGKSHEVLRSLPLNSYDIVYIDGSHIASDVLQDAVLVWQLVKIGGFIIFDDYPSTFPENPAWNTRIGIDAFMRGFTDKFRLIHKAHQVIIEKTS